MRLGFKLLVHEALSLVFWVWSFGLREAQDCAGPEGLQAALGLSRTAQKDKTCSAFH
jgi:hypothetical protein